jgi:DNA repair protein RadC
VPNLREGELIRVLSAYRPRVAAVRVIESTRSRCVRPVRDRETNELLAMLLDAAGVEGLGVDALAQAIDSGGLRDAAAMPDEPSMDEVVPAAALAALAAAFELTRRAVLPHVPAIIRGPADVAAIARRELGGSRREHVLVIACDAGNRPLRSVVVAHGAVDRVSIPVREILTAVLRCDGRAFAVAHNHPCGDPEPSDADVEATESVAEAARAVGLRFLGHVAVGRDDYRKVGSISESRKRR